MAAVVVVLFAGVWWTGITSLDERMNTKFEQASSKFDGKFDQLRSEFRAEFNEVRAEFKEVDGKFNLLNAKFDAKFDGLFLHLQRSAERFEEEDKRHLNRQYITIRDELRYRRPCASNGSSAAAAAPGPG
jgi:uncharacterized protein YllA (UPF0747 family)